MASSIVLEPKADPPNENTLIVIVNNDGTVSVDPEALQSVLENEADSTVSVVRLGKPINRESSEPEESSGIPHVNLTVEGFYLPTSLSSSAGEFNPQLDSNGEVDLFSLMDTQQMQQLERALQSEQACHILGNNVLDMFGDNDDNLDLNTIDPASNVFHIDHCYTNRLTNRQIVQMAAGKKQPLVNSEEPNEGGSEVVQSSPRGRPPKTGTSQAGVKTNLLQTTVASAIKGSQKILVSENGQLKQASVIHLQPTTFPGRDGQAPQVVMQQAPQQMVMLVQRNTNDSTELSSVLDRVPHKMKGRPPKRGKSRGVLVRGRCFVRGGVRSRGGRGGRGGSNSPRTDLDQAMEDAIGAMDSPEKETSEDMVVSPSSSPDAQKIVKLRTDKEGEANTSKKTYVPYSKKIEQLIKANAKSLHQSDIIPLGQQFRKPTISTAPPPTEGVASASDASALSPPSSASALSASAKKYPRRENRKPPAHLADAFSPDLLFSTPDIIRRVPTKSESESMSPEPIPSASTSESNLQPIPMNDDNNEAISAVIKSPEIPSGSEIVQKHDNLSGEPPLDDQALLETLQDEALLAEALLLEDLGGSIPTLELMLSDTEHVTVATSQAQQDAIVSLQSGLEEAPVGSVANSEVDAAMIDQNISPSSVKKQRKSIDKTPIGSLKKSEASGQKPEGKEVKQRRKSSDNPGSSQRRKSTDKPEKGSHRKSTDTTESSQASDLDESGHSRRRLSSAKSMSESVQDDGEEPSDEQEGSDDESWNSEDDPDRLWCICKKPHNNRFMICCDSCEEWFHGQCVGVTKAMGARLSDWRCPNCSAAPVAEKKVRSPGRPRKEKIEVDDGLPSSSKPKPSPTVSPKNESETPRRKSSIHKGKDAGDNQKSATKSVLSTSKSTKEGKDETPLKHLKDKPSLARKDSVSKTGSKDEGKTEAEKEQNTPTGKASLAGKDMCIECKKAVVRPGTMYCSDNCITQYAEETVKSLPQASGDATKEVHVTVMERKTGRLFASTNGPLASELSSWLLKHPTFEVIRPSALPNSKYYSTPVQGTVPASPASASAASSSSRPPAHRQYGSKKQVKRALSLSALKVQQATAEQQHILEQSKAAAVNAEIPTKQSKPKLGFHLPKSTTPGSQSQQSKQTPKVVKQLQQTKLIFTPDVPTIITSSSSTVKPKVPSQKIDSAKSPAAGTASPQTYTSVIKVPSFNKTQSAKKLERKPSTTDTPGRKMSTDDSKERERDSSKTEPIRQNVSKTLQEALIARLKDCDDMTIPQETIQTIAVNIEEELFSLFKDTGAKYKAKYRSLIFNIKDLKNPTLFRRIADGSLLPAELVKLSAEELAPQELARWREQQTQHQLEMIRKSELDLLQMAKSVVMKTHKGEQEIETETSTPMPDIDPNTTVTDLVTALNDSVTSTTVEEVEPPEERELTVKEREQERREKERQRRDEEEKSSHSRSSHHKHHKDKDKRRSHRDKDKHHSRKRSRDDSKSSSSRKSSRDKVRRSSRDHSSSSSSKKRKESRSESVDLSLENISIPAPSINKKDEINVSDHEPTSTVTIKTPERTLEEQIEEDKSIWRGVTVMLEVARFSASLIPVSGNCAVLAKELKEVINCIGRIPPQHAWDYLGKMRKYDSKEMALLKLTSCSANQQQSKDYMALYTYLSSRDRLGVAEMASGIIKDFYILPLDKDAPIPPVLASYDGPALRDRKTPLLLCIVVMHRGGRKRSHGDVPQAQLPPTHVLSKPPPSAVEPTAVTSPAAELKRVPVTEEDSQMDIAEEEEMTNENIQPDLSSNTIDAMVDEEMVSKTSANEEKPEDTSEEPGTSLAVVPEERSYTPPLPSLKRRAPVRSPKRSKKSVLPFLEDDDDDEYAPYSPGGGSDADDNIQQEVAELDREIEEKRRQIESLQNIIRLDHSSDSDSAEEEAYSPSRAYITAPSHTPPQTPPPQHLAGGKIVDPIVQNYAAADESPELEEVTVTSQSDSDSVTCVAIQPIPLPQPSSPPCQSPTGAPSSSLPVSIPPSPKPSPTPLRDPRNRNVPLPRSTLSDMTDEDLIKKAEQQIAALTGNNSNTSSLMKQPPPPGVDDEPDHVPVFTTMTSSSYANLPIATPPTIFPSYPYSFPPPMSELPPLPPDPPKNVQAEPEKSPPTVDEPSPSNSKSPEQVVESLLTCQSPSYSPDPKKDFSEPDGIPEYNPTPKPEEKKIDLQAATEWDVTSDSDSESSTEMAKNRRKLSKDRSKSRDSSRDRSRSGGRSRERSRSKELSRERSKSRSKGRSEDRSRSRSKGRSEDRSRSRSRESSSSRSRSRSRGRARNRSRDCRRSRSSSSRSSSSSSDRNRSSRRERDRSRDRDRSRNRDRNRGRDWNYRERWEPRDRDQYPHPRGHGHPGMQRGRGRGWTDRGRFRGGFRYFRGRGDFRRGQGRPWQEAPPHQHHQQQPASSSQQPPQYHGDIHDNSQFEGDIRNFEEKQRERNMKIKLKEMKANKKSSWDR